MSRPEHRPTQPDPHAPLRGLCWCLRVGLVLQCAAVIHTAFVYYTPVNVWLFMERGLPEETARLVDRVAAGLLALCAASALCAPRLPALAFMSAWFIALSLGTWSAGGHELAWLAPANHALRALAPIALWLLLPGKQGSGTRHVERRLVALWLLRLSAAATFAGHGLLSIRQHPPFIDLILGSTRRLADWTMSESTACGLLETIGVLDLAVAALILVRPLRYVPAYMACWGLISAASRVTERGLEAWPELLLRSMHWLAPLGLFLYWSLLKREAAQA